MTEGWNRRVPEAQLFVKVGLLVVRGFKDKG